MMLVVTAGGLHLVDSSPLSATVQRASSKHSLIANQQLRNRAQQKYNKIRISLKKLPHTVAGLAEPGAPLGRVHPASRVQARKAS